jgi:hypothetical protein
MQEPSDCKLLKCILEAAEACPDLQHTLPMLELIKTTRMQSGGGLVHNCSDGFFLINLEKTLQTDQSDIQVSQSNVQAKNEESGNSGTHRKLNQQVTEKHLPGSYGTMYSSNTTSAKS